MSSGLRGYVKKSSTKALNERVEYSLFGNVYVYVKDPLPQEVDLTLVLQKVENTIPRFLAQAVESIFIGQFEELISRDVAAVYDSGTIYLTNEQESDDDMFGDIVHEIAHSVESWAGMSVYGDGDIEKEFLIKRKKLFDILSSMGYNISLLDFVNVEYSKKFDFFLYKSVGYDKINMLAANLFLNAYSVTSIREYFATGFEEFLLGDKIELNNISPILFKKVEGLIDTVEEY